MRNNSPIRMIRQKNIVKISQTNTTGTTVTFNSNNMLSTSLFVIALSQVLGLRSDSPAFERWERVSKRHGKRC